MKILSVGGFNVYGESNTCLHRHWALETVADSIEMVNTVSGKVGLIYKFAYHLFQLGLPIALPDQTKANKEIKKLVDKFFFEVVWIDKGITIFPSTLAFIKTISPKTKIIGYSPDNMALRHNQSYQYLRGLIFYDHIFTNKSYIINNLISLGAKKVHFVNNCYESKFHYPMKLSSSDYNFLGAEIGFIGAWEKERCESIKFLVNNGLKVTVFGSGRWEEFISYHPNLKINKPLFSEAYTKALQIHFISLCFLRKKNFDLQTTRSVEIPACGGFMLAERTNEHMALFEEGKEAAYFSDNEELLRQCKFYLLNPDKRHEVARAGRNRCENSGYSNEKTVARMLKTVMEAS